MDDLSQNFVKILGNNKIENIFNDINTYIFEADNILSEYEKLMCIATSTFVYGSGKRKTAVQKHYEKLAD